MTDEAIAAWHAPATGKRGGQLTYSDLAIETGLALRLVLRLGLRQIEGTLGSIAHLLGVDIKIPDHTTFMWTAREWQPRFAPPERVPSRRL